MVTAYLLWCMYTKINIYIYNYTDRFIINIHVYVYISFAYTCTCTFVMSLLQKSPPIFFERALLKTTQDNLGSTSCWRIHVHIHIYVLCVCSYTCIQIFQYIGSYTKLRVPLLQVHIHTHVFSSTCYNVCMYV